MNKKLINFIDDLLTEESWVVDTKFYDIVKFNENHEHIIIVPDDEFYSEMNKIKKIILNNERISSDKKTKLVEYFLNEQLREDLENDNIISKNDFSFEVRRVINNGSFTEKYGAKRKKEQIETLPSTLKILSKFYTKQISIDNTEIYSSLRIQLKKQPNPYEYVEWLLNGYNSETKFIIDIIVNLGKDPGRKSIAEKIQKDEAKNNGVILKSLPAMGKNALYIINNKIVKGVDLTHDDKINSTKSLDFIVENSNDIIYTCNKYLKESGGSQDNTIGEIKNIITQFSNCDMSKILLILDGDYLLTKLDKFRCQNKNKNLLIICSDDYQNKEVQKFINLK